VFLIVFIVSPTSDILTVEINQKARFCPLKHQNKSLSLLLLYHFHKIII